MKTSNGLDASTVPVEDSNGVRPYPVGDSLTGKENSTTVPDPRHEKTLVKIPKDWQTQLTPRMTELLRHYARGLNCTETAAKMNILPKTVTHFATRIRRRLNLPSQMHVRIVATLLFSSLKEI